MARLSPWLLVGPADLNADALKLLALVHQSPTVKDAAERFRPPVELEKIMATVQYFPALRLARSRLNKRRFFVTLATGAIEEIR